MSPTPPRETIAIYVTPFYNSEGPEVGVEPLAEVLATATPATIGAVAEAVQGALAVMPAHTLFVLAIRLYDLGWRDEGLYWFYLAQYRARLLRRLQDEAYIGHMGDLAFELNSAHSAFMDLAGPYFNGYAGCDQTRWLAVIARVQAENQVVIDFSIIYPGVVLVPAEQWADLNRYVNEGMSGLADSIRDNWDELQAVRRENGADERFCT